MMSMKLVKGETTRKVNRVPASFAQLQSVLETLYGRSNLNVLFHDEHLQLVSIQSDEDLFTVYRACEGQPSVRLFVKEHTEQVSDVLSKIDNLRESIAHFQSFPSFASNLGQVMQEPVPTVAGPTCRDCKKPIEGTKYQCFYCRFLLCETCEQQTHHDHPFVKIRKDQHFGDLGQPAYQAALKIAEPPSILNKPVTVQVKVKNCGVLEWPAGSQLVLTAGEVVATEVSLPRLQSGQAVTVPVTISVNCEGLTTAVWQVQINQILFGKLKQRLQYAEVDDAHLNKLKAVTSLGVSVLTAKQLLQESDWDLLQALSKI